MFADRRRESFCDNLFFQLLVLCSCSVLVVKAFNANYHEGFPSDLSETCGIPRLCYSCASMKFGRNWEIYKLYFRTPANFTVYCDPRMSVKRVPLVECKAPCTTVIEPVFLMGTYTVLIAYTFLDRFSFCVTLRR